MVGKFYVSIVLLFVRFALGQSCDCKLVDILRNIVQKEMMEREILASRVDMLESLLGSGTRNIASSSTISSEAVILERLGELETTTENIKTQLKGITMERQKEARLNSALTKAWRIHKLGFSNLTEDIKQSSSNNNKIFHNLLTDFDKNMRLFEYKFEELLNKSNNVATKQKQEVGLQFDTIRSNLNTTFNDYKSRMDTDMMVFINKTEKQLHDFRSEFEGLINRTNKEATTQQKQVEERFDTIRIVLNRTVDEYKTRTSGDLMVFINKTEKSLYDIRAEVITDECASNPCVNRATCLDGIRKYSCICMDGFNGTNCQTEIDECASHPCMNGATCVDAINGYSCRCQAGYMYAGTTCQIDIVDCSSNPCKNGATCVDALNSYTCRCVAGYSGLNCQIVSVCNVALTGPAGEITSPNYPYDYPSNTDCYYRISVATGHRVRIVILHFVLEHRYDFLKIYDGADTSSTMMAELTGRLPSVTTYISTTNVMFLRFTTDGSTVYSGFRLQYSEVRE